MHDDLLFVARVAAASGAAASAIATALVRFADSAQPEHAKSATRAWFESKWFKVSCSNWLHLPRLAMGWAVGLRVSLVRWLFHLGPARYSFDTLLLAYLVCVAGVWLQFGWLWGLASVAIAYVLVAHAVLAAGLILVPLRGLEMATRLVRILAVPAIAGLPVWVGLLVSLPLPWAALSGFALLTLSACLAFQAISHAAGIEQIELGWGVSEIEVDEPVLDGLREKYPYDRLGQALFFWLAMSGGFGLTLISFLIGLSMHPAAETPRTLQFLLSNAVCDGLTLVGTVWVLSIALRFDSILLLAMAVLADLFLAGVLACTSLWLGLFETPAALAIDETLNVLLGRSRDGARGDFGPLFWAMHTTFIPTLFYLAAITVCGVAKAGLVPLRWFLGAAGIADNPLRLSASLCALIASIFAAFYLALGLVGEMRTN